ncbi:carbamoyltransferase [Pelagibacteraceae bacterium]|nr:carbamoyltransferase [Pelagibacteraceae bacterium]
MSYILGISAFYHDSSAALIKNDHILGAVQEERFTRIKHDSSFPKKSIEYLLNNEQIKLNDLEAIVFYEKPFLKFERLLETYIAFAPFGFKSFAASMPVWLREKLFQKDNIFKNLQELDENFKDIKKIKFSEHHLSHAASAFYPSPFNEALILTLDGVGEWSTTTVSIGNEQGIKILKEISFPHSLGLLYSAFTYYLGFKVNSGEYKVMGLAPYGEPKYKDIILDKILSVKDDGSFKMNMKYFDFATDLKMTNKNFENLFGQKRRIPEKENLTQFHMDVASSIQKATEDIVIKITRDIRKEYNIKNLCMSGGVALNCVANGKILNEKIFDNIWIQPASGDAGGSLGAALAYWHIEKKNNKNNTSDMMSGSYLGPQYNNEEIENDLKKVGAKFEKYSDEEILIKTSKLLNEGNAIGWFQGKMEYGPRALGARSIIADPRSDVMQKNLNLKVKFRESFRPFAPSIIKEKVSEFFKLYTDSPYMLLVAEIQDQKKLEMSKEEKNLFGIDKLNIKRSTIPAITHVDYSARIQTVNEKTNPKYYKLLKKFEELTGCPVLINTSFNVRGEPIVCSPLDAFNCLMGTNLDYLVIENFILKRDDQKKELIQDYKNKYQLD